MLRKFNPLKLVAVTFLVIGVAAPAAGFIPRKLDDATATPSPESGLKCGSCPSCNNQCYKRPPPPPTYLPPPPPTVYLSPPPEIVYLSPPPPPKKPKTPYCPPPPTSGYIYITGPPGNLYPIDTSHGGGRSSGAAGLLLLIGCGLVWLLAFG